MPTASKTFTNGLVSIVLIYAVGLFITAFSQSILDNLVFNLPGLFALMMMLFFFKVVPFVPFLFIVYFLCRFLVGRASVYVVLTLIVVLFLLYGYLIWRGEFFHIYQFDRPNYSFRKWWAVETGELHFNIASFVSTFYFVWMTFYRNNKPKMREVNKTYVNAE